MLNYMNEKNTNYRQRLQYNTVKKNININITMKNVIFFISQIQTHLKITSGFTINSSLPFPTDYNVCNVI